MRVVENTLELDLRNHRPSTVTKDMIQWADMILLMDAANWQALSRTFPAAINKAVLLGATTRGASVDAPEIRDPYQLEDHLMQAIALTIKCRVQELLDQRAASTAVRDTAPQFN